jgi:hypothetical protein
MILLKKPEKSDYLDLSAYRPIILLNTLGKILEAVVTRRIRYVVEKYNLLLKTQIGVKRGRSTETVLYFLTEKVYII